MDSTDKLLPTIKQTQTAVKLLASFALVENLAHDSCGSDVKKSSKARCFQGQSAQCTYLAQLMAVEYTRNCILFLVNEQCAQPYFKACGDAWRLPSRLLIRRTSLNCCLIRLYERAGWVEVIGFTR